MLCICDRPSLVLFVENKLVLFSLAVHGNLIPLVIADK